ncbi:MAG: hypothetical protein ABFD81_16915 [Syntrophaceae bacterium]
MRVTGLIFFILAVLVSSEALAFYEHAGDKGSFKARLAVDLSSGFAAYPGPREFYPEQTQGVNSLVLRILGDAAWEDRARLELNAYQLTGTRQQRALNQNASDEPYRYLRMRRIFSDTEDYEALAGLDQASLKLYADPFEIAVGRQPIGLANNFIFTPNDLFYPFGATAVDREFRPGVDSLRLNLKTGALSGLSIISVMGYDRDERPDWDRSAALVSGVANLSGTAVSFLGGKADGRHLAGLGLSAEALGLGWRLEGNYSRPTTYTQDPYVQISLGFDKRWASSLHLVVEYYYHENGRRDPEDYLSRLSDPLLIMDPYFGRHYLGLTLMGEASPLFTVETVAIVNLDDGSAVFGPAVIYNAADEIEFILSAELPYGKRTDVGLTGPDIGSEYGLYPRIFNLLGRIYF